MISIGYENTRTSNRNVHRSACWISVAHSEFLRYSVIAFHTGRLWFFPSSSRLRRVRRLLLGLQQDSLHLQQRLFTHVAQNPLRFRRQDDAVKVLQNKFSLGHVIHSRNNQIPITSSLVCVCRGVLTWKGLHNWGAGLERGFSPEGVPPRGGSQPGPPGWGRGGLAWGLGCDENDNDDMHITP